MVSIDQENAMSRLSNKIAVVTGASKGIGAEIARELAAAGASVVVNYVTTGEKNVAERRVDIVLEK
jgi:3-oxoacyl-[acyl-carrier protein] reductase